MITTGNGYKGLIYDAHESDLEKEGDQIHCANLAMRGNTLAIHRLWVSCDAKWKQTKAYRA